MKDILSYTGFSKATYMYWPKRFDRENPDIELENTVLIEAKLDELLQIEYIAVFIQIYHIKKTTDTTEFKHYEVDDKGRMNIQKLYLDPYMDMFNAEILTYSIGKQPSAANVMNALNEAITITSDCVYRRTFHSDRGWAYQMYAYSSALKENKIYQSMSRKGNCYDNSVMENFFGIMKQEMYYGCVYYSYEELKESIKKYIDYYNNQRIKQKLAWMSPVEYRLSQIA